MKQPKTMTFQVRRAGAPDERIHMTCESGNFGGDEIGDNSYQEQARRFLREWYDGATVEHIPSGGAMQATGNPDLPVYPYQVIDVGVCDSCQVGRVYAVQTHNGRPLDGEYMVQAEAEALARKLNWAYHAGARASRELAGVTEQNAGRAAWVTLQGPSRFGNNAFEVQACIKVGSLCRTIAWSHHSQIEGALDMINQFNGTPVVEAP